MKFVLLIEYCNKKRKIERKIDNITQLKNVVYETFNLKNNAKTQYEILYYDDSFQEFVELFSLKNLGCKLRLRVNPLIYNYSQQKKLNETIDLLLLYKKKLIQEISSLEKRKRVLKGGIRKKLGSVTKKKRNSIYNNSGRRLYSSRRSRSVGKTRVKVTIRKKFTPKMETRRRRSLQTKVENRRRRSSLKTKRKKAPIILSKCVEKNRQKITNLPIDEVKNKYIIYKFMSSGKRKQKKITTNSVKKKNWIF